MQKLFVLALAEVDDTGPFVVLGAMPKGSAPRHKPDGGANLHTIQQTIEIVHRGELRPAERSTSTTAGRRIPRIAQAPLEGTMLDSSEDHQEPNHKSTPKYAFVPVSASPANYEHCYRKTWVDANLSRTVVPQRISPVLPKRGKLVSSEL